MNLSDLGTFTTKFYLNSNSLRKFNTALRFFKQTKADLDYKKLNGEINDLLTVLKPITKKITGHHSNTIILNEDAIVATLSQSHPTDWQQFKDGLISITNRLENEPAQFSKNDITILEDVAYALDSECANLFRRMSGRL